MKTFLDFVWMLLGVVLFMGVIVLGCALLLGWLCMICEKPEPKNKDYEND